MGFPGYDGPRPSPPRSAGQVLSRSGEYTAWLLRTSRRAAVQPDLRTGTRFAAAFKGGSWPTVVGPSTLSRWENAVLPVPRAAVLRYEELLGLAPGSLLAPLDTYRRYTTKPEEDRVDLDHAACVLGMDRATDLQDLFDRVVTDHPVNGREWDRLSAYLCRVEDVLLPSPSRLAVVERLVTEMLTSDSVQWMQRFEALNRFLVHPRWRDIAIATCVAAADDSANPAVVEAICALDGSGHPDAAEHVVRRLREPHSDGMLYGALLSCVRKTRFGHFTDAQLVTVAGVCADVVTDTTRSDDGPMLAAELLRRMSFGRVPTAFARLGHVEAIRRLTPNGRLVAPRVAEEICGQVAGATAGEDPIRHQLVDDVLHSPVYDVRLYSAMVLAASPHRRAVAMGLGRELTLARRADPHVVRPLLSALRVLGLGEQRRVVEGLVLSGASAPAIVKSAVHALAHLEGTSSVEFWCSALEHYTRMLARPNTATLARSILPRLVYGIGIAGEDLLLRRLREDDGVPDVLRTASLWWRGRSGR